MIYAEIKENGKINQVWYNITDKNFAPPLSPEAKLVSFDDKVNVKPGMVYKNKKLLKPKIDLTNLKESSKINLIGLINSLKINDNYPEIEQKSFPYKLQAAKAYLNNTANKHEKEILSIEAKERKISVKKLAEKIVQKNLEFNLLSSRLSAIRDNAFTEIDRAKSEKTIQKIINKYQEEIKKLVNNK